VGENPQYGDAEQWEAIKKNARSRAETKTKESKTHTHTPTHTQRKCREKSVLFSGLVHFIAFSSRKRKQEERAAREFMAGH